MIGCVQSSWLLLFVPILVVAAFCCAATKATVTLRTVSADLVRSLSVARCSRNFLTVEVAGPWSCELHSSPRSFFWSGKTLGYAALSINEWLRSWQAEQTAGHGPQRTQQTHQTENPHIDTPDTNSTHTHQTHHCIHVTLKCARKATKRCKSNAQHQNAHEKLRNATNHTAL